MSYHPLISVVIPTFNRARQTIAAIESVLGQTYPHFEIIVVDDGSTDGSGEVIQTFVTHKSEGSHQIHFLRQRNQGASSARNTGIAGAQGDYIAFLDSDDVWIPEKLEWQVRAFELFKSESRACVTDARLVNSAGLDTSSFRAHRRPYKQTIGIDRTATTSLAESFCGFWISSLMVEADILRKIGGLSSDISFAEDRDLHFRLSLITSIAYVNKQLIIADRNASPLGSTCRPWDKQELQFAQQQRMLEKWLRMDGALPADVRSTVKRSLGALHSSCANWHLENARYAEARRAVGLAVKYKAAPGTTLKFALTWLAPALASRITPKTRPIGTGGHAS